MARLPSLSALKAFEAAARHLSFTRAAEELQVTQAAISHQVKALEDELGVVLFARSSRRVALTEEGRILARAVSDAFERVEIALGSLARASHPQVVNVSVSPSLAVKWLLPRLDDFRSKFPEIDVRISANDRLIDPLREGVDLCLRYGSGRYPGLTTTLLMVDDVFPVCSPKLMEGPHPLRNPNDLKHHSLLQDEMMKSDPNRPDWLKWFEAARTTPVEPKAHLSFSHAVMMLDAALAGQGVALGRSSLVSADLEAGRLVRPFGQSFRSKFAYWIAVPEEAPLNPRVAAFHDWLVEQAKESVR